MTAREAILERVHRARKTGRFPPADELALRQAEGERLPSARPEPVERPAADRFIAELIALGVECHVEPSADAVRARVRELVAGRTVLAWDAARLPYGVGGLLSDAVRGSSARELQAAAEVGVTGCDAAIAETGSLVLLSDEGKPRTASLLPPVHLAVVRRADICPGMGDFLRERAADVAAAACCTFVTGPSRTADIELTLTLGVHGPGRVIVVLGP